MAIYRELFFNNLQKLLGNTFPVLKKLHDRERWRSLVRAFMAGHRAHTPYFLEIPREFLTFLEKFQPSPDDFPFLRELAHYEWVELAVSVSPVENDLSAVDPVGDLLRGAPVRSELAWPLSYRFPVHRISPTFLPRTPGDQPTHLVVYRRANDEVGFMELNPVTARLLEMIDGNAAGDSGRALIERLAGEIRWPDVDALIDHGRQALEDMRGAEILLGTRTC